MRRTALCRDRGQLAPLLALGALLVGGALVLAWPEGQTRAPRPHIVVLMADDLGWSDVGYHGGGIETPRLDALAAQGTRFAQFYVTPNCSMTRAALLTGRHPFRYGLHGSLVRPWSRHGLPGGERTLAESLRDAGYETHLVGKWHLGHARRELLPQAHGFDHHYGHYTGSIDYLTHRRRGGLDWHRDGEPLEEEGYSTTLMADEAIRLIEGAAADRPLFLTVAFNAAHRPLRALPEDLRRFAHVPQGKRRTFSAVVYRLDLEIGRILEALERTGLRRDTLVVFLSDNGGARFEGASNAPWRGGKGHLYEGGVRVPAIAAWPGRIPAGAVFAPPVHVSDLLPTLLAAAGLSPDPDVALDGVDLLPALVLGAPLEREVLLVHLTPRAAALRMGPYKLLETRVAEDGGPAVELFDLADDPAETTDVSAAHPEVVARMRAHLEALRAAEVEAVESGPRPSPYEAPRVWGPDDPA